ncbi:MAG: hypothetical protein ABSE96_07290 [Terracidiphilus sp.]|jgi:hypothetical protein
MAIVVVGGSGRNAGKTSLVCGLIAALPEFRWTAAKITSHAHGERDAVREETAAGQDTDTARYLAAGARRAFLVTAVEEKLPIAEIQAAIGSDTNLIFESNRMLSGLGPNLRIGLIGGSGSETKPSFESFLKRADALVMTAGRDLGGLMLPSSVKLFRLDRLGWISSETIEWVRARLNLAE